MRLKARADPQPPGQHGSASSAANQQYAGVTLYVYYSCSSGWYLYGAPTTRYTLWLYSAQTYNWRANGGLIDPIVSAGRYYTYAARTTWYNSSGWVFGQETYYPTTGTTQSFTTSQSYVGNSDFACVGYAYSNRYCAPFGLATVSWAPTGKLYVLRS